MDCPVCIYRHPFRVPDDRDCPNLSLSEQRCRAIFNKGLDQVLRPGVSKPVSSVSSANSPVSSPVSKPVSTGAANKDRKAYMRELMRSKRALERYSSRRAKRASPALPNPDGTKR